MKIKLEDFLINKGKNSRPIPDSEIIKFIEEKTSSKYLYNETIVPTFIQKYYDWIQKSKLNKLLGLKEFNDINYACGTSQVFDFFYLANRWRFFRCLKGEYIYHKVSWKNNFNWSYLENIDELSEGSAFVISVPFSDLGAKHPDTEKILNRCDDLNIPVLIDMAYYCISRDLEFDLNHRCITTVAFSLSKAFYGVERLRIGLRCRRKQPFDMNDDGMVLLNQFHSIPKISAGVGLELIKNFNPDYTQNKFRDKQIKICNELNIKPSNCVIFGLADKTHPEFGDYNRGTDWRRVCISSLLEDCNEINI